MMKPVVRKERADYSMEKSEHQHKGETMGRTEIRFNKTGSILMVWDFDHPVRRPTQHDIDTLPVGRDMTDDEIELLDD